MGETTNIAQMAELISTDVFEEFGWERTGPTNENWECVLDEHPVKTHPADVVFWYTDPYSTRRVYVMTDLKSYASGTITKPMLEKALRSLGMATDCSQLSKSWKNLFLHRDLSYQAFGLLFVYNHDGAFDRSFTDILLDIPSDSYQLRQGNRMYVVGPQDVCYLKSVTTDLKALRGTTDKDKKPRLPQRGDCSFYYPDLYARKVLGGSSHPATLEMITGPWQILEYGAPASNRNAYLIYYRSTGKTRDEFLYLIDFLFHYQLLHDSDSIQIRSVSSVSEAAVNFEKAVEEYARTREGEEYLLERLKRVSFQTIPSVITQFSSIEIGLDHD